MAVFFPLFFIPFHFVSRALAVRLGLALGPDAFSGSGDGVLAYLSHGFALVVATIAAVAWTVAAGPRDDARLHSRVRVFVRYVLGWMGLV